jgi:hypothetical protein
MNFLRELKEQGLIVTEWISGDNNPADLFTKNLQGPTFERHAVRFVGFDEYMDIVDSDLEDAGRRVE